jgi:hypothetical protein
MTTTLSLILALSLMALILVLLPDDFFYIDEDKTN